MKLLRELICCLSAGILTIGTVPASAGETAQTRMPAQAVPPSAQAQLRYNQFRYDHLGFANGLKSQRVYSMVEGRHGEMWFSMKNGVARYNGQLLKNYTLGVKGVSAESGGKVIRLLTTPDQKLLAYDNKGNIFVYHTGIDHFEPYATRFTTLFRQIDNSYNGVTLNHVNVDEESWMWMSTSRGLFVMRPYDETIFHWDAKSHINGVVNCGQECVVYTSNGSYLIDRHTGRKLRQLSQGNVVDAFYDALYNRLWMGTSNAGVQLFDAASWQPVDNASSLLPSLPAMAIEQLDASTMLIGFDGAGVFAGSRSGGNFCPLFSQDDQQGGVLHGNGIYDICRDHEGNIWICSYTGGVDIAYPTGQRMELFEHKRDMERSLINNGVNATLQWHDYLVFGTDRGVSLLDTHTKQWRHTLHGRVVLALCDDGENLLVGTYGEGVYRVNDSGEYRKAYSCEQGNLESNHVYSLAKDAQGGLWIGCLNGALMHYTKQKTQRFDIQTVECMVPMPNGHMAVGTANGFFDVDSERGVSTHFFLNDESREQKVNNYVKSMLFASADTAWIATDGGGLYAYRLSTRTFKAYTTADGLNSNCIYGLAFDTQGRIVASTDCGLSIFYPTTGKAMNINYIPDVEREYNRSAVATLNDGKLLFGSNNGAVIIDPKLIAPISYQAPLRFSAIRVKGKLTTLQQTRLYEALREGQVNLDYAYRSLEVAYESINYRFRGDLLYQYILEGFSKEWSAPAEQSVARFENLPAGSYTLKVRCVSRISGRIIDTQQVGIHIAEPWWNSFWAWMIYLALAALLVWTALRIIGKYYGTFSLKFKPL